MNKYLWVLSIVCYDEFPEVEHMFTFGIIYMNRMIDTERFFQFPLPLAD